MEIALNEEDDVHPFSYELHSLPAALTLKTSHSCLAVGEYRLIKALDLYAVYFYHFKFPYPASNVTRAQLELASLNEIIHSDEDIGKIIPIVSGENDYEFVPSWSFAPTLDAYTLALKVAQEMAQKMAQIVAQKVETQGTTVDKRWILDTLREAQLCLGFDNIADDEDGNQVGIMSAKEFEEQVGLKGVEVLRNRNLIKWCKKKYGFVHFFDSDKQVEEHVTRCGRSFEDEDLSFCSKELFMCDVCDCEAVGACVTFAEEFVEVDNVDCSSNENKDKNKPKDRIQLLGNMIKTAGEVALVTVTNNHLFNKITVYGCLFDFSSNMSECNYKLCLDFTKRRKPLLERSDKKVPISVAIARTVSLVNKSLVPVHDIIQ